MDVAQVVDTISGALAAHNAALGATLIPAGKRLVAGLGVTVFTWRALKLVLGEGGPQPVIAEIFNMTIIVGFLTWFLNEWGYVFQVTLVGGFDWITVQVLGSNSAISAGIAAGMSALLRSAQHLWETSPPMVGSLTEFASNFPAWLAANLFRLATMLILIAAAVIYAGYALVSQILVGIALLIGPVLVPWMLVDSLSFVYQGWLRFLIIACFYRVSGALLVSYTIHLMPALEQVATLSDSSVTVDVAASAALLLVAGVMIFLVIQTPVIANGLVSGHVSANFSLPRVSLPGGGGGQGGGGKPGGSGGGKS